MKKVALVFILAVFVPSLVLAWLAVRSLRDQQFLLERQESLLYQGIADSISKDILDALDQQQRSFTARVGELIRSPDLPLLTSFDERLRKEWPLAQVGFIVTLTGDIVCPSPFSRPEARIFCADNSRFLGNRESAEVYWNPKLNVANSSYNNSLQSNIVQPDSSAETEKRYSIKSQARKVMPQQQASPSPASQQYEPEQQQLSKVASAEAEFRQLIGDATEGTLARFVDNKLNVLFWCRSPRDTNLILGAQLSLQRLVETLKPILLNVDPLLRQQICVALLDDNARPAALSHTDFHGNWKRPFVATEVGESLPHWEIGVYLLDPARLSQSAHTLKLTLGLLIAVLILAIATGSWLIVSDLNRQLALARQKTDFVSNVSHELKTPLTSIRMFSELLAEGRVTDPVRQRSYLSIITAEASRLTRLINNVLDFARLERGDKKYDLQKCDLVAIVADTIQNYCPQLEANGFRFESELPTHPLFVNCDRDALSQIVVNLLSNAEKYSSEKKELILQVRQQDGELSFAEVSVLDRGVGVPSGSEEKIFEQFYRAHDSLSSGIQGSGLGLTLARQIARAHGGDVVYQPRPGGGSSFALRVPLIRSA